MVYQVHQAMVRSLGVVMVHQLVAQQVLQALEGATVPEPEAGRGGVTVASATPTRQQQRPAAAETATHLRPAMLSIREAGTISCCVAAVEPWWWFG